MKKFYLVILVIVVCMFASSCTTPDMGDGGSLQGADGADGKDGTNGKDGVSCSIVDNDDGTVTIACADGTVVVRDGVDGEDGTSCSIVDNDDSDGTSTITCGDETIIVHDGEDGQSCTVRDNGNGTSTLSCPDGSEVVIDNATSDGDADADTDTDADTDADSDSDTDTDCDEGDLMCGANEYDEPAVRRCENNLWVVYDDCEDNEKCDTSLGEPACVLDPDTCIDTDTDTDTDTGTTDPIEDTLCDLNKVTTNFGCPAGYMCGEISKHCVRVPAAGTGWCYDPETYWSGVYSCIGYSTTGVVAPMVFPYDDRRAITCGGSTSLKPKVIACCQASNPTAVAAADPANRRSVLVCESARGNGFLYLAGGF